MTNGATSRETPTGGVEVLRGAAVELLHAVDEGRPVGPLVQGLAVQALRWTAPDSAPWCKAVEVLEGGVLRVRRAVDLAGLVLDAIGLHQEKDARAAG